MMTTTTTKTATAIAMAAITATTAMAAVEWSPISLPTMDPAKNHIRVTPSVSIDGNAQPLAFHTIARSGQGFPCLNGEEGCEEVYGLMKDNTAAPVMVTNDTGYPKSLMDVSDNPDFSSLIQVGDSMFSLVQFEWPNPGVMYLLKLDQDAEGNLHPTAGEMIDWSHQGGLWIPCAGSLSPWNTHIGGEEYEPDAKYFSAEYYPTDADVCGSSYGTCLNETGCEEEEEPSTFWADCGEIDSSYHFAKYLGGADAYPVNLTLDSLREMMNPYDYGYVYEVAVEEDGSYAANKWYAAGRRSNELAYILPDEKTMYLSDDGTNVVFQKFVADEPKDFSSGTLYAAKMNQETDGTKGGTFGIEWIDLGPATSAEIEEAAKTLKFHDIMDKAEPEVDFTQDPPAAVCPEGFTAANTGGTGVECLKVKEGMETVASRLESRRYSAMLGATTELSKFEGVTYDPQRNVMYAAVSSLKSGMEDMAKKGEENLQYDIGGNNDIRVTYNPCGCIYTMELDEANSVTKMMPLVCGDTSEGTDDANACNINEIANPDNVVYVGDGLDTILIAEDTTKHENNILWAYDPNTNTKERILMVPLGAEVTSPYLYTLGDWSYIMAVAQHPYQKKGDDLAGASSSGRSGNVGYIGPLKLSAA